MHEMSIAQSLLEIVMDESRRHGLTRVDRVRLQIGALAAVVPDALTFCFGAVARGTVASEAVLEIETVPVVARCPLCGERFEMEDLFDRCPDCGLVPAGMDLVSGREMTLMSIEGETDEDGETDERNQGACRPQHSGSE